jgi:AraC-like DNA-binding protein
VTRAERARLAEGHARSRRASYAEQGPSSALSPWVECYWTMQADDASSQPTRVLPDGCADVIVDLSRAPNAFAVGPMRVAAVHTMAGRLDFFGIRFRPGAASTLLDVPLAELCDQHVPLDVLWGPLATELADALAGAPNAERVRRAEHVLAQRVGPVRADDALVAHAVALMRQARGSVGVRQVAAALGIGERRLERAFAHRVGLSPKFLARVERLRHAVALVDHGAPRPWTALAYDAGYADQAHLVREFRALAGITPAAFAAERRRVGFVQYEAPDGG